MAESEDSRKLRLSILASVEKHAGGSSDLHGLALAKAKRYMIGGLELMGRYLATSPQQPL
ncbi:hypothetical protein JCM19046_2784 [Bacillus sp. JCM 19046]|nr:hypothetical protein JCM19046_2784 [Bacillus sp. JCM 19046]